MASALRPAILRHIRIPIQTLTNQLIPVRSMSSHGDDHLTKEEVVDRVLDVVKSFPKVDPSKVTPDIHFQKDLGLDSLDTVEIVMALEEEFKLEIPDKEADKISSCGLAIEYISNHPMAGNGKVGSFLIAIRHCNYFGYLGSPLPPWLKVNFDGALSQDNFQGDARFVVQDHRRRKAIQPPLFPGLLKLLDEMKDINISKKGFG